jgi:tetratricopeptide (TPR) repeat protein
MNRSLVALAVVLGGLAPARWSHAAAEEGPSIEEMFSALKEEPKKAPAAALPSERTPTTHKEKKAARRAAKIEKRDGLGGEAVGPRLLETTVEDELRKIEARASERLAFFKKDGRQWQTAELYIRLEKFTEAAHVVGPMLRTRNTGRSGDSEDRARRDKLGGIELTYACIMTYLGREGIAGKMLAAYRRRFSENYERLVEKELVDRSWVKRWHEPRVAFVKGYPKSRPRVESLKRAAENDPDPRAFWALVRYCNPWEGRAPLALTYFKALVEVMVRYPDNPYTKRGAIMWELDDAYRHHELYEESIKLIESMPKRFPQDSRVLDKSWLYFLGKRYSDLGRMLSEMRNRKGAYAAFRKSLAALKRMREENPRHRYCRERDDEPAVVDELIGDVGRYIRKAGGR